MRPLPLSTCVIFQPANPLSTLVFRSRCNFSSRNTPVIESSLVQLLGILPLRRLAPFLPPLFSRRFSTIRLNRSPFRFSLASTKSVCLDATSEKLEDRNCSDVTEFLFFFSKLMILSYREIFLVLSKRSWGLWSWIIIFDHFSKERRFLFSKKIAQIRVNKGSCFPRGIFSPGKFDFNNSLPNFRRKLSTATSKCLIIESSRLSKFYFHGDPVIRNDPRRKNRSNFQRYLACDGRGKSFIGFSYRKRKIIDRRNSFQRAYCGWLRVLKRGKNPKGQTKLAIK